MSTPIRTCSKEPAVFKLLKRFKRIHLEPGETQSLLFELGPDDLQILNRDWQWVVEPGEFEVLVGKSSEDIQLTGGFKVVN